MSYILEALKKSERERSMDAPPGKGSLALAPGVAGEPGSSEAAGLSRRSGGRFSALFWGLSLGLMGLLAGWFFWGRGAVSLLPEVGDRAAGGETARAEVWAQTAPEAPIPSVAGGPTLSAGSGEIPRLLAVPRADPRAAPAALPSPPASAPVGGGGAPRAGMFPNAAAPGWAPAPESASSGGLDIHYLRRFTAQGTGVGGGGCAVTLTWRGAMIEAALADLVCTGRGRRTADAGRRFTARRIFMRQAHIGVVAEAMAGEPMRVDLYDAGGSLVNAELARQGLALSPAGRFSREEGMARRDGLGLWAEEGARP